MWSYEAKRLFRDRLVGEKAQNTFDTLLSSILMTEWNIDLSQHENEPAVYYVTWAAASSSSTADQAQKYGRSLGRLTAPDLKEVVSKGILSYSEYMYICTYVCIHHRRCMCGDKFWSYVLSQLHIILMIPTCQLHANVMNH